MFSRNLNGIITVNANQINVDDIAVSDNVDISNNLFANVFLGQTYSFFTDICSNIQYQLFCFCETNTCAKSNTE